MLDLHKIKADFADLVLQVQPWTLTQFVMWLDLKIAEFKVNGYMALDQSKRTIPRWLEDEIFDPSSHNGPNGPTCCCRNVANGNNSNDYESLQQNTNHFEISASVRQRSVSDSLSKNRPENELLPRNLYNGNDFLRLHQICANASDGKGSIRASNECIEIRDDKNERVPTASSGRMVRCANSDDNFSVVKGRGTVDISRRKQSRTSRTDQSDSVKRSGSIQQNYETDSPECIVIPTSVSSNSVPSQSPTASRLGSITGPRFPDRYVPDRITPILMVNNVHQPKVTSPKTQNSGNDVISIDLSSSLDTLQTDNIVTSDASPLNLTAGRSSSKPRMSSIQAVETSSLVSALGSLSPSPTSLVSAIGLTTSSGSSVVSTSRPVDTFDLEEVDMKPDVNFLQECLKSVDQQQHITLPDNFEGGQNISMQHSSSTEVTPSIYSREDENNTHFTASSDREQTESRPNLSNKSRISLPNFDDPYLKNLLEMGNAKVIWSKLVGICASHLLAQCNGQPSCADYQAFSKALYQKYPSIAMDRGPNPWSVFKKALSQKIRHTRFKMRRGFSIRDNNMRASYLLSNRYQNGRFGSSRGRRAVSFT